MPGAKGGEIWLIFYFLATSNSTAHSNANPKHLVYQPLDHKLSSILCGAPRMKLPSTLTLPVKPAIQSRRCSSVPSHSVSRSETASIIGTRTSGAHSSRHRGIHAFLPTLSSAGTLRISRSVFAYMDDSAVPGGSIISSRSAGTSIAFGTVGYFAKLPHPELMRPPSGYFVLSLGSRACLPAATTAPGVPRLWQCKTMQLQ